MSVVNMRRAGTVVVAAAAVIWADPSGLDAAGEQRDRLAAASAPAAPSERLDSTAAAATGTSIAAAGVVALEPGGTASPER